MRLDGFLLDHPAQHRRGAISRVANEPLRLQIEALFYAIDHHLRGFDFRRAVSRRYFHIENHAMGDAGAARLGRGSNQCRAEDDAVDLTSALSIFRTYPNLPRDWFRDVVR